LSVVSCPVLRITELFAPDEAVAGPQNTPNVHTEDCENAPNEPTAGPENTPNEPTESSENLTNEPTAGPLSAVSSPSPVAGCEVDEPKAPNEPTESTQNVTNEPTEPVSGPLSAVRSQVQSNDDANAPNEAKDARRKAPNDATGGFENPPNEPKFAVNDGDTEHLELKASGNGGDRGDLEPEIDQEKVNEWIHEANKPVRARREADVRQMNEQLRKLAELELSARRARRRERLDARRAARAGAHAP